MADAGFANGVEAQLLSDQSPIADAADLAAAPRARKARVKRAAIVSPLDAVDIDEWMAREAGLEGEELDTETQREADGDDDEFAGDDQEDGEEEAEEEHDDEIDGDELDDADAEQEDGDAAGEQRVEQEDGDTAGEQGDEAIRQSISQNVAQMRSNALQLAEKD